MKTYDKYKDSGIEWLGEIPEHWELKKTRHYFNFSKGLTITKENLAKEGIPCVSYGEIHSKFGFEVNPDIHSVSYVSKDYIEGNEKSMLSRGDFVFADTSEDIEGSGNFTHLYSDQNTFAGYHTIVARLKTNDRYRYMAYLLDSINFRHQIRSQVKGVKVFSITNKILKDTFLWSPSIKEQTAIASYLDHKTTQIDILIEKKEQLIEKLKLQRQAIINEAVTKGLNPDAPMKDSDIEWLGEIPEHWEVTKLKYIGDSITGITYSPDDIVEESQDSKLVLRSSNIQEGRLELDNTVYVNKEISQKYIIQNGDILICSRNGSRELIGKNIRIDSRVEGETWGAFMTVFRSKHNDFIYYFFNSQIFKALSSLFLSSTINQLTIGVLNDFVIALPSDSKEQNEIVNFLKKKTGEFDTALEKLNESIEKLKLYRQSLISEAVTGKIDLRDWSFGNDQEQKKTENS